MNNPATTLALLKLDAVVGVRCFFDERNRRLESVALPARCVIRTVDKLVRAGIGNRLDGWAARDLNVGAIIAFSRACNRSWICCDWRSRASTQLLYVSVLRSWGPGKFDAELLLDGKAFRPGWQVGRHTDSAGRSVWPA
jgi:hypothetical protein